MKGGVRRVGGEDEASGEGSGGGCIMMRSVPEEAKWEVA